MKNSAKNAAKRAIKKSQLQRFERLFESVALLMLREGTSDSEIAAAMHRSLLAAKSSPFDTPTLIHLYVVLSDVLHAWHEDPNFIDQKANPIALPLRGRGKSLASLIVKVGSTLPAGQVLESLRLQRLIRTLPNGRFKPTKSVAHIRGDGPEMSGYLGKAVMHLIETNDSNSRRPRGRKALLDRAAIVEDLPLEDAEAFVSFSAEQGANVVANANAWLESRRLRNGSMKRKRKTTTAGLHVFAFLGRKKR